MLGKCFNRLRGDKGRIVKHHTAVGSLHLWLISFPFFTIFEKELCWKYCTCYQRLIMSIQTECVLNKSGPNSLCLLWRRALRIHADFGHFICIFPCNFSIFEHISKKNFVENVTPYPKVQFIKQSGWKSIQIPGFYKLVKQNWHKSPKNSVAITTSCKKIPVNGRTFFKCENLTKSRWICQEYKAELTVL